MDARYIRHAVIQAGIGRWEVWQVSTLTGDRKDCVAEYTHASTARAVCRRLNDWQTPTTPKGQNAHAEPR